jgi:anthraniloyl-CoA monooxygenase
VKVAIIGGGPAGLYTAILLQQADPAHEITVVERNQPDDTFGWGVVFSDQTLDNFRTADEPTYRAITSGFAHWDDIDIVVAGRRITSGGHGFSGIARKALLEILHARARELGVTLRFCTEVRDVAGLAAIGLDGADVIVAADGINSAIRREHSEWFGPDLDVRTARYVWLGTTYPFNAFTFYFVENAHGVFQAHCYRFGSGMSTFIVECDEDSWLSAGFGKLDTAQTIAACEEMFGQWLDGHRLLHNAGHRESSRWSIFGRARPPRGPHDRIVLVGDAAHTAHFSIGSGTKLAMEDAIALARGLSASGSVRDALARYQDERMTEALRLQNAARNSMEWFEHVKRYIHLPPEQFAYSLLTRSQRVSHENLRMRDATFVDGVERWFASRAPAARPPVGADQPLMTSAIAVPRAVPGQAPNAPPPPMFTPFRLRELVLSNRVVVSPMDMYSAEHGTPNDFHLVHLGARALGGAALVMTEMVCVSPGARITLGCSGLYSDEQLARWTNIVRFVHTWSPSKICLQLGHSGRKGSTCLPWEGTDVPIRHGGWEIIAPSPLPYNAAIGAPREMTRADMDRVREDFVRAASLGAAAGFDMLELHAAHGYLLSSFLTPVSNARRDAYGGSLANRLRFPLEVFSAVRAAWPAERPTSVRVSATDWAEDGISDDDAVAIAHAFVDAGADIIHVSTGQTSTEARPVFGRLWQTPFSDRIRNEARVPTIAVGNVTDADQVNSIIAAGRADLVAIGRPHLSDPHWTLHAAATLGYSGISWPNQYYQGRLQLEREVQRARQAPVASTSGKD